MRAMRMVRVVQGAYTLASVRACGARAVRAVHACMCARVCMRACVLSACLCAVRDYGLSACAALAAAVPPPHTHTLTLHQLSTRTFVLSTKYLVLTTYPHAHLAPTEHEDTQRVAVCPKGDDRVVGEF